MACAACAGSYKTPLIGLCFLYFWFRHTYCWTGRPHYCKRAPIPVYHHEWGVFMKDRPSVLIFGGGVGGLTAAHELIERDFDVTVFEARHWGGKVRSMGKAGTGTDGRKDLPGEHGFHFFPTFYQHIPDTMKRIPFGDKTVFDNIVEGTQELIARTGKQPHVIVPSHMPKGIGDIIEFFKGMRNALTEIPTHEFEFFLDRILTFMCACDERRIAEFDIISWWDFIEAGRMSEPYQQLMGRLPSLLLIAIHPTQASARTLGNAFVGMLQAAFTWNGNIERSLNGPPSDKWADPWVQYVGTKAKMVLGAELLEFHFDHASNRITGARIRQAGAEKTVTGDYYICALPLEVAAPLITQEMRDASPSLAGMAELCVSWMNGIQFFLDRPLPIINGHVAFEDSAWALTSVSQHQFWKDGLNFEDYGNGNFREVFSVIISDWDTRGTEIVHKPARECTPEEIFEETLAQVNAALSKKLQNPHEGIDIQPIPKEAIIDWFLDPDIEYPWLQTTDKEVESAPLSSHNMPIPKGALHRSWLWSAKQFSDQFKVCKSGTKNKAGLYTRNAEPLYITTVGAWEGRPESVTAIPNFFLASDYVRTVMDFASAEGANEAGRKAANGVLHASNSDAPHVKIWPRDELDVFVPLQWIDRFRFEHGKQQLELPGIVKEIMHSVLAGTQ